MTESLRILMTHLIDYAGLFPPARLPMKTSIDNFAKYQNGEYHWMLNRFALPAERLSEFPDQIPGWRLAVIGGNDLQSAIAQMNRYSGKARIESVEIKGGDPEAIGHYAAMVPKSLELYIEAAPSQDVAPSGNAGARAKLRTGGETAEMFPSCEEIAHFLSACARARVPFKCSAGLHHPLRGVYRYTYEPDSPSGTMHGFLNVFLAAAFACNGMSGEELERMLCEESADAFRFEDAGIHWRDRKVTNEELSAARNSFCLSFGSCSFEEPIEGLRSLGLL